MVYLNIIDFSLKFDNIGVSTPLIQLYIIKIISINISTNTQSGAVRHGSGTVACLRCFNDMFKLQDYTIVCQYNYLCVHANASSYVVCYLVVYHFIEHLYFLKSKVFKMFDNNLCNELFLKPNKYNC